MPYVPLRDGQRLHVRVLGRGHPVLMLPGFGMKSAHWLPFLLPYLRRFRFYLPDFRGFGRSAKLRPNQPDVFHNHMEDVQDLIAHFELDDFLLAGMSLGGSTSLHLLRESGFKGVRRYLHIDQSPCVGNRDNWPHGLLGPRQPVLFARLRTLLELLEAYPNVLHLDRLPRAARREAIALIVEVFSLMGGGSSMASMLKRVLMWPGVAAWLLPLSRLEHARAYLTSYLSGGHDYRDSLRRCPVPITLMVGMRSTLYPPEGQIAVLQIAPQARVVCFQKSGHVPLLDEPLRFVRELGRFLDGD